MRDVSLMLRICFDSCIVLIFTNQPSLSINSGVHSSLHPNFHHQFVHTSFNLDIYYPPLSPHSPVSPGPLYQRLIWDYEKVDSTNVRKALDSVNWERLRLLDEKDLNSQVVTLNEIILNVLQNYIPSNYINIDDKNSLWMNEIIRLKMKKKKKKNYTSNISKMEGLKVTLCLLNLQWLNLMT